MGQFSCWAVSLGAICPRGNYVGDKSSERQFTWGAIFRGILSGGNYLWSNCPGAIIQGQSFRGQLSWALYSSGAIIRGTSFLWGQLSSRAIVRGGNNRGAINQGTIFRGAIIRGEFSSKAFFWTPRSLKQRASGKRHMPCKNPLFGLVSG